MTDQHDAATGGLSAQGDHAPSTPGERRLGWADIPQPKLINGFPRRARVDLLTPAERAIYDAVQEVERAGAHVLLTDAVILLQQARDKVADFVELEPKP